jgi:hypothetical protein
MATITQTNIIAETLRNGGSFQGDPVPALIFAFKPTMSPEQENYAVFYEAAHCDIYQSPYVSDPICLWDEGGITPDGTAWLEKQ